MSEFEPLLFGPPRLTHPEEAAPTPRSWTFEIPGRPLTFNQERKGTRHWSQNRAETKQARTDAAWLAKEAGIPHLERIAVVARPILRDRRTQDVAACFPAVKAAIDGLRDAGVITDDGPDIVVQLTFDAPSCSRGRDALEVTVEEVR